MVSGKVDSMKPKTRILPFLSLLLLGPTTTHAAIFDAADFLRPSESTIGGFGEIVLSEPTSEGLEAHARHGLNPDWNLGAVFGTGGKNKRLRTGFESVYNLAPDYDGQLGISFLGSLIYLRRDVSGGLYTRVVPMIHKRVVAWNGLPGVLFVGMPLSFEIRSGNYTTTTALNFGGVMDVSSHSEYYMVAEAGIKLARGESMIAVGVGYRFGEVELPSSNTKKKEDSREKNKEEEYRSEDFQK